MQATPSIPDRPPMGWLCSYTPVEIIWAAGYFPLRLTGHSILPRGQDPRIYHLLCPFVRSIFHSYAPMEAPRPTKVVFVHCCDGMLRLYDLWKAYLPGRVSLLDLPKIATKEAVLYYSEVLRKWASRLSGDGPREVTTARLKEAIGWMNEARSLFLEIHHTMIRSPGYVPYSRYHAWSRRWLAEPTESVISQIRLEYKALLSSTAVQSSGARVLLTSTMLDQTGLIRMIEDAGLEVVAEDECMGARHFEGAVSDHGDPFLSLAERYLTKWPCPRMKDHRRRLERLDQLIDEAEIQGVIAIQLKYCDQSAFDLPLIKAHLEAKGIPLLIVENDYGEGSLGQIRVRIEAFSEILQPL